MWYAILFLVIGLIITALGFWTWRDSDHDNGWGLFGALIGVITAVISIWQIVGGIKKLF